MKKINKNASPELSTRLKYMITSVNGDEKQETIREFVDYHFLSDVLDAYIYNTPHHLKDSANPIA